MMNKGKKTYSFFLILTLTYLTIYNSAISLQLTSRMWIYFGYFLYAILLAISFFSLINRKQSIAEWIYQFLLVAFAIFFIVLGNLNTAVIFVVGLYALMLVDRPSDVLKDYLISFSFSFVVVVALSFMGIIPMHNYADGTLLLGFRNPNTTGFYLTAILAIHWVLNWEKLTVVNILEVPIVMLLLFKLNDFTAMAIVILLIIFRIFKRNQEKLFSNKLVSAAIVSLPLILTFLSIWIGKNFLKYSFMTTLNNIVTSRPAVWNYYLSNYNFNLFGNKLADVVTFGINRTVGHGTFDGEYVYFPIVNGVIAFTILMVLMIFALRKLIISGHYELLVFFILYIISGLSEDQLFIYFQCPVLILSIMICSPNYTKRELAIKNEKRYEAKNFDCNRPIGGAWWGRDHSY